MPLESSRFLDAYETRDIVVSTVNGLQEGAGSVRFGGLHEGEMLVATWRAGKRDGKAIIVGRDGKKRVECEFENDELNGPVSMFHPASGRLGLTGRMRSGMLHGEATEYGETGSVLFSWDYRCGVRQVCGEVSAGVFSLSQAASPALEEVVVGDDCFCEARVFSLEGLQRLRTARVGSFSFCRFRDRGSPWSRKEDVRMENRCLSVTRCPVLESLVLGHASFTDTLRCVVASCLQLESVRVLGKGRDWSYQFLLCHDLVFRDLPRFASLVVSGWSAFSCVPHLKLAYLPSFRSLEIRSGCVFGFGGPGYSGQLTLLGLPSFSQLSLQADGIFYGVRTIRLDATVPPSTARRLMQHCESKTHNGERGKLKVYREA